MPSVLAFYRPRGIAGTYVVGLQLDLRSTESVHVGVMAKAHLHYGSPFAEEVEKEQDGGKRRLYRIEKLLVGDVITIRIEDKELYPFQTTIFTATPYGFQRTDEHCTLSFPYEEPRNFGVVILNEITMIDLDNEEVAIQAAPSN